MLSDRSHPSPSAVFEAVRRIHPTVSLATVYKTIGVLQKVGLVQELCVPKVQARLDSRMEPHINLICLGCGAVEDLEDGALQKGASELARGSGILETVQRTDLHGLCRKCLKARRARLPGTGLDRAEASRAEASNPR